MSRQGARKRSAFCYYDGGSIGQNKAGEDELDYDITTCRSAQNQRREDPNGVTQRLKNGRSHVS